MPGTSHQQIAHNNDNQQGSLPLTFNFVIIWLNLIQISNFSSSYLSQPNEHIKTLIWLENLFHNYVLLLLAKSTSVLAVRSVKHPRVEHIYQAKESITSPEKMYDTWPVILSSSFIKETLSSASCHSLSPYHPKKMTQTNKHEVS